MKKIFITILLAGAALQQLALSQTNTDAPVMTEADTNTPTVAPPAVEANTNTPSAVEATTNATAAVETNTPSTNAPPVAAPEMAAEPANTPASVSQSIPLIQFQDVPLTTAIENLARQAGINYLMDPKIGFGQPDANGQIKTEPTLSIRWENITAQDALIALLNNYNLQLVADPKTKISRITTKDPTAPPPLVTQVIQLKYASVSNIQDAVSGTLTDKRSHVVTDSRTSQIVIVATEKEQTDAQQLIDQLDKPTRQVLIETRLVEVSSNPSTRKGIDWSGTLSAQNVAFGNNLLIPSSQTTYAPGASLLAGTTNMFSGQQLGIPSLVANTASGFGSMGFLNADGLSAVISFLNSSSDAQVVSTPRVVTLDNETANIEVTRSYPIFNTTAGTQGSPGGSSVTYSNLGTTLEVTPRISANDYIWLKVVPEVSSFFGDKTVIINGLQSQAPQFDVRKITTQVLIPNANTLVMGGLVKDSPQESFTKVPVLGDIPWLGYAFRSESKSVDKVNLLIFLTPTIVQDSDFRPTTTEFLKSQPKIQKPMVDANSMWESSKPRNWSNPGNTDPTASVIDQKTTE
jgi:type II secretory pathway component GspD/PulD (secretin)